MFTLLITFQVKHFIIDFLVQFERPDARKKFDAEGWVWPLFKHANDHAMASALIVSTFLYAAEMFPSSEFFVLTALAYIFDLTVHFTMDRIKASPHMLGKYKYPEKKYFVSLAADQAVHHITHYVIIMVIMWTTFSQSQGV